MRLAFTALCVLVLVGCGREEKAAAPNPAKEQAIAAAADRLYSCARRVAPHTPNGQGNLDLQRIETVVSACTAEEGAVKEAVRAATKKDTGGRAQKRLREIRTELARVIRANPYQPPTAIVADEQPEPRPAASTTTVVETNRTVAPRLSYD